MPGLWKGTLTFETPLSLEDANHLRENGSSPAYCGICIVPVVRARSALQAEQASQAVCAGGIPIVKITIVVESTITVPGAVKLMFSRENAEPRPKSVLEPNSASKLELSRATYCICNSACIQLRNSVVVLKGVPEAQCGQGISSKSRIS